MIWDEGILNNIAQKIDEQKIVPVVGPGAFEVFMDNGRTCSIHEYLVDSILNNYCTKYGKTMPDSTLFISNNLKGMSRLSRWFENVFNRKKHLVSALKSFYEDASIMDCIRLKKEVREFLINGRFPLVLTTCNFPRLQSLITYKCRKYDISIYRKDTSADIPENQDNMACLFYLLGGLGFDSNIISVITENDFLSYIHGYLGENQPIRLKKYLSDRYLLTLGCEIPNWTFRFLLYSLKVNNPDQVLKDDNGDDDTFVGGAVSTSTMEEDITEFLEDINYKPGEEISSRLEQINAKLTRYKPNIFLSMSSTDYPLGDKIQEKIEKDGKIKLWFYPNQKKNPQYWLKIDEGLRKCEFIIPVITQSLINRLKELETIRESAQDDGNTPGFIVEWVKAAKHKKMLGSKLYCAPFYIADNQETKDKLMAQLMNIIEKIDGDHLVKPLLFPKDEGAEALDCYTIEKITSDLVWKHFELIDF